MLDLQHFLLYTVPSAVQAHPQMIQWFSQVHKHFLLSLLDALMQTAIWLDNPSSSSICA